MVMLMRHRQTKGPVSARLHLNRRATPRLHPTEICRVSWCYGDVSLIEKAVVFLKGAVCALLRAKTTPRNCGRQPDIS